MNDLDLSLFQFDPDLTWSAMFVNPDGTVYGRYGSRSGRDAGRDVSLDGFKKAMEMALALHAGYPANRATLAGKSPGRARWPRPEALPWMPGPRPASGERIGRGTCVHCHMLREGEIGSRMQAGLPLADALLWPFPMPERLGFSVGVDDPLRVTEVRAGSPAHQAGLRQDDRVVAMQGQAVLSLADMQWVLHRAPAQGTIALDVARGGGRHRLALPLGDGWRRTSFMWRASTESMRRMWGFRSIPLSEGQKEKYGVARDRLALRLKEKLPHVETAPTYTAAGLMPGDILVEIGGQRRPMTESDLLAWLARGGGRAVSVVVRRGDSEVRLQHAINLRPVL